MHQSEWIPIDLFVYKYLFSALHLVYVYITRNLSLIDMNASIPINQLSVSVLP